LIIFLDLQFRRAAPRRRTSRPMGSNAAAGARAAAMGRTMSASLSAELKILDTPPEVPAGISMREVETREPSAFKTIRALINP
jgi:hypothetical protein